MQNVRAWFEITRLSNLPTVWTNVLTGFVAGRAVEIARRGIDPRHVVARPWADLGWILNQAFMMLVGASLLYVAGMIFNDVADRRVDSHERPTRPIPSGRVSVLGASIAAGVCGVLGLGALGVYRPSVMGFGLVLAGAILAYDLLHKRTSAAVPIMGVCRGLLVLTAAAAYPVTLDAGWLARPGLVAGIVFAFVTLVTALARGEAGPGAGAHKVKRLVPWLLAGLCLLDAGLLVGLGQPAAAIVAVALFLVTVAAQRVIPGT